MTKPFHFTTVFIIAPAAAKMAAAGTPAVEKNKASRPLFYTSISPSTLPASQPVCLLLITLLCLSFFHVSVLPRKKQVIVNWEPME
jgi:hypothetical protein